MKINLIIIPLFLVALLIFSVVGIQASALGQLQGIASSKGACFENCPSGSSGNAATTTPKVDVNAQKNQDPSNTFGKNTAPPSLDSGIRVISGTVDYAQVGYFQGWHNGKEILIKIENALERWKNIIRSKFETKNPSTVLAVRG